MLIFESATPQKFAEAIHLAIKNDIILVVLPGGKGKHFTQPVGAMLSKVVKKFTSIAYKLSLVKDNFLPKAANFPFICNQDFQQALVEQKDVIVDAFKTTGKHCLKNSRIFLTPSFFQVNFADRFYTCVYDTRAIYGTYLLHCNRA